MGRPKKPLLSRPAVVRAALEIMDRDGLEQLSLKRLAAELGVHESSIYHYYRYKHEILGDVLRHVLSGLVLDAEIDGDWKHYLIDSSPLYYRALSEHPQMVSVLTDEMPRKFGLLCENQTARILIDAGFPPRYVLAVREQLEALTNGALRFAEKRLFDAVPAELSTLNAIAGMDEMPAEERFLIALHAYVNGLEIQLNEWKEKQAAEMGCTSDDAGASPA
jgi:TetR/AcrR family transcriptional regulator, tetracycline repressor protein